MTLLTDGLAQMVSHKADVGPAEPASEQRRFARFGRSLIGLLDFVICVFLLSLFFQGTVPGVQPLREAFRQIYSFMMDPNNLVITGAICVRLILYGFSRCLSR